MFRMTRYPGKLKLEFLVACLGFVQQFRMTRYPGKLKPRKTSLQPSNKLSRVPDDSLSGEVETY